MYFTNISNDNVAMFHNKILVNANLRLTEVLNSNLFKIEEIISNKIYRIFPLFYCENITSTNPYDKILSNKCIICQKSENTVLSFSSEEVNSNLPLSDFYYIYEQGFMEYIVFYCFDNNNKPLSDVNANCVLYSRSNNALIGSFDIQSNNDGSIVINKEAVDKVFNHESNGEINSMNIFLTHDKLFRNYSIHVDRVIL